ncbi:hypothetical protein HDU99_002515, partial [Rhizoclosmatium hyalinum]
MALNSVITPMTGNVLWRQVVQLAQDEMKVLGVDTKVPLPPEHFFKIEDGDRLWKTLRDGVGRPTWRPTFKVTDPRIFGDCVKMWKLCNSAARTLTVGSSLLVMDSELTLHLAVLGEHTMFISQVLSTKTYDDSSFQALLDRRLNFLKKFWKYCDASRKLETVRIIEQCESVLTEMFLMAEKCSKNQDCANRCSKISVNFNHVAERTSLLLVSTFRLDEIDFEDPVKQIERLASKPASAFGILIDALSLSIENNETSNLAKKIVAGTPISPNDKGFWTTLTQKEYSPDILEAAFKTVTAQYLKLKNAQMDQTIQNLLTQDDGLIDHSCTRFLAELGPHILFQRNLAKMVDSIRVILVFGGEKLLVGSQHSAFEFIMVSLAKYLAKFYSLLKDFTWGNTEHVVHRRQIDLIFDPLRESVESLKSEVEELRMTAATLMENGPTKLQRAFGQLLSAIEFHDGLVSTLKWNDLQLSNNVITS